MAAAWTRSAAARLGTMRRAPAAGFTLFEVAVSLAILAVGVLSVIALFPAGIRAQRLARFQLYAAAKAIELIEENAGATNTLLCDDVEAPDPWDTAVDRRTTTPDLECRLVSRRFGVAPLPTALARRLDSDDGEIARLLDQGADLYYPLPQAPTSWDESAL